MRSMRMRAGCGAGVRHGYPGVRRVRRNSDRVAGTPAEYAARPMRRPCFGAAFRAENVAPGQSGQNEGMRWQE